MDSTHDAAARARRVSLRYLQRTGRRSKRLIEHATPFPGERRAGPATIQRNTFPDIYQQNCGRRSRIGFAIPTEFVALFWPSGAQTPALNFDDCRYSRLRSYKKDPRRSSASTPVSPFGGPLTLFADPDFKTALWSLGAIATLTNDCSNDFRD